VDAVGVRDIHANPDPSIQAATEEQEMAQIRTLLEERSAARAEVQRLERERVMQTEQLRMMEERMADQELTEEELAAAEDELARAGGGGSAECVQGVAGAGARVAAGADRGVEPAAEGGRGG
jgi:hypothetical protein